MKITVKIADIEVTIDRPDFQEVSRGDDFLCSKNASLADSVNKIVHEASEQAKALYLQREAALIQPLPLIDQKPVVTIEPTPQT